MAARDMSDVDCRADTRQSVLRLARSWLDTPYRHQASIRHVGCDCLGLVRGIWRELYSANDPETLPNYTPDWAEEQGVETLQDAARRWLIETSEPQPGDALLFRLKPGVPCKHVGILSASDRLIHAYWGHAVVESWLQPFWSRRVAHAFAFPPAETRL